MKIAVFKTSLKENENRLPIYPEHLPFISRELRNCLFLEKDYGKAYGYSDNDLADHCRCFLERDELINECDLLMLPKPVSEDLKKMHHGQVLWGWAHCIQQHEITQIAIDKKISIVAWEEMHLWKKGEKSLHIFYKNNEIAGYSAVLHALSLLGLDGHYGPRRRVAIISYGSVSRGAIYALQGRGFNNLHVYTRRQTHLVADQNPDVYFYHLYQKDSDYIFCPPMGNPLSFIDELSNSEIIVNGILQDPNNPTIFIRNDQIRLLKRNSLIIDVSCDEGMGFEFAKPTSFENPLVYLPNNILYYSVDHTPSYLWNAASREISKAVIPFLTILFKDSFDFTKDDTLRHAVMIKDGNIINKDILAFQKRSKVYPHLYL